MTNRWLTGAAAAAIVVAGAFAAQAADLPTKKAPVAPIYVPPPFTWTGFYVGVNAGAIFSQSNSNATLWTSGFPVLSNNFNGGKLGGGTGFLGGGQAGYNWQTGSFVLGVETDFDGSTLSKNTNGISPTLSGLTGSFAPWNGDYVLTNGSAKLSWLGTTRARVGFVATPDNRLMVYGTGGVAYGGGSAHLAIYDANNNVAWYGSKSNTRVGWTIGGGVEYAITNNVTIKGEYLYYNLGSTNSYAAPSILTPLANASLGNSFATAKVTYQGSIVRAGVNYKF
jgi:outer membrane immunogenic protein